MATLSDFDQADYYAEIKIWFDRVDEQIDLETKRLATVRRGHTSLFRRTKYSRGDDEEIDALERMVTITDESTTDGSTTDGSTSGGSTTDESTTGESTTDGSTTGEFNRKRNMSNRWLRTNTPRSGKLTTLSCVKVTCLKVTHF